jgi:hypothetical protein
VARWLPLEHAVNLLLMSKSSQLAVLQQKSGLHWLWHFRPRQQTRLMQKPQVVPWMTETVASTCRVGYSGQWAWVLTGAQVS